MSGNKTPLYDQEAFGKTFPEIPDDVEVLDTATEEINVLSEIMALDDDLRCVVVKAVYLVSVFREIYPDGLKRLVSFDCDSPLVEQSFNIFEDLVTNFIFWDDTEKPELTTFDFPGLTDRVHLRDKFSEVCGKGTSALGKDSEFLMLSENRAYDLGALSGSLKEHLFRALKIMEFAFRDQPVGTISDLYATVACDNLSGTSDDEIFLLTLFEGKRLADLEPNTFAKKYVA